jgi:hypothetical protein
MKKAGKSVLQGILEEERERLESLARVYAARIHSLPKGYISVKNIKNIRYAYLCFREKDKVRSIYLGKPSSDRSSMVIKQIAEKKVLESKLKLVRDNLAEIRMPLRRKHS